MYRIHMEPQFNTKDVFCSSREMADYALETVTEYVKRGLDVLPDDLCEKILRHKNFVVREESNGDVEKLISIYYFNDYDELRFVKLSLEKIHLDMDGELGNIVQKIK